MALLEPLHNRLNEINELLEQLAPEIAATAQQPYARRIPQDQHDRHVELLGQRRQLRREANRITARIAQIDPTAENDRRAQRRVLVDAERARIDARMAQMNQPANRMNVSRSRSRSRTRSRTRSRSNPRVGGRKTRRRR